MENIEAAYILYLEGWEQKRIAAALKVSEKTVGEWKRRKNWERQRTETALAKETSEHTLWELISYQLQALKQKTEEFRKEGKFTLLDKGDIDALTKMYSSVKGKQHTWAQIVEVVKELLEFIAERDFTMAREITELADEFLMTKKSNL